MKFRTDFVTNSSSSSFVTVTMKSQKFAEYLEERMDEIEETNMGYCDVEIDIDGDTVEINTGDCDVCFYDAPTDIMDAVSRIIEICHLDEQDEDVEKELAESVEKLEWIAEEMGLDGDDGRYDRSSYDPEVLQDVLEEVAVANDCEVDDVTDEMFTDFVRPDPDTVVERASFDYNKSAGKNTYHYSDDMHKPVKKESKI